MGCYAVWSIGRFSSETISAVSRFNAWCLIINVKQQTSEKGNEIQNSLQERLLRLLNTPSITGTMEQL